MKKLVVNILTTIAVLVMCITVNGAEIVRLPLSGTLLDSKNGLTDGKVYRDTAATYINNGGVLQTAHSTRENLDSDPDSSGRSGANVTQGAAVTSPTDGFLWTETTATGQHRVNFQGITVTANETYVYSTYVKAYGNTEKMAILDNVTDGVTDKLTIFDLSSGSVDTEHADHVAAIQSVGDSWYRISIVFTVETTSGGNRFCFINGYKAGISYTGTATNGFYLAGNQIELLPSGNTIGSDLFDQETLGSDIAVDGDAEANPGSWANYLTPSTNERSTEQFNGGASSRKFISDSAYDGVTAPTATSVVGTVYKVKVYIYGDGINKLIIRVSEGGGVYQYPASGKGVGDGWIPSAAWNEVTFYYIPTTTTCALQFLDDNDPGGTYYIDDLTIEPVTAPAKGIPYDANTTGQAWPGLAGSELITNGNFTNWTADDPDSWTLGFTEDGNNYVTEDSGKARFVADTTNRNIQSSGTQITTGNFYKLSFDITASVSGVIRSYVGAGAQAIDAGGASSVATHEYYFYATATGYLRLYTASGTATDITIDNVSVRQVQTEWTPFNTNSMEIDETEEAILFTGDGSNLNGGWLRFRDSFDLSADPTLDKWYMFSFQAKVGSGDTVKATLKFADGDEETGNIAETFTDYTMVARQNDLTDYVQFSGLGSGEELWIRNMTYKEIPPLALLEPSAFAAGTIPAYPRFESEGLLVEGESVNIFEYSEDFSEWQTTRLTSITKDATGPDGVANSAYSIIPNTDSNTHQVYYDSGPPLTDNTEYTFSIFAKANLSSSYKWIYMEMVTKTPGYKGKWFDLENGALGASGAASDSSITALNNGWYRCTITDDITSGTSAPRFFVRVAEANNDYIFAGDGTTVTTYVYGAQLEENPYPTSYIPTDGQPATRTTEAGNPTDDIGYRWTLSTPVRNILGNGGTPNAGTFYVTITPGFDYTDYSANAGVVSVQSGLFSLLYITSADGGLYSYDGTTAVFQDVDFPAGTEYSYVIRWDDTVANRQTYELHGGTWSSAASGAYDDDWDDAGTLWLNYSSEAPIHIKHIRFFDEWVADDDLEGYGEWKFKGSAYPVRPIWDVPVWVPLN